MTRTRRILVASLLVVAAAGCAPSPSPSPSPSPPQSVAPAPGESEASAIGRPVSGTTQRDGLIVTLAASSDRVQAGDRIRLRVTALNAGLGPAAYMAGGCGPIGGITITGGPPVAPRDAGDPPQGTDAASVLGLARWSALSQGSPGVDWIRIGNVPDDLPIGCPADLRYEDLDPGATFADEASWIARTGDGVPAPAGDYTIELAFPFAGRRSAEEAGAAEDSVAPIAVSVPVTVEGGEPPAVDATAAVDAAIADAEVIAWAERALPRERLTGATISFVDGRWRFRIGYQGGEADVYVDPATGQVVERRLGS